MHISAATKPFNYTHLREYVGDSWILAMWLYA
jgi:hypothetical protein